MAKTLPVLVVSLPLPCISTVFVAKTLPLPRVSTAFVAKTLPFLAALLRYVSPDDDDFFEANKKTKKGNKIERQNSKKQSKDLSLDQE